MAKFDKGNSKEYELNDSKNGVYIFVLKGSAKVGDQILETRDGFGIWETSAFNGEATEDSEILLMEIPMDLPRI